MTLLFEESMKSFEIDGFVEESMKSIVWMTSQYLRGRVKVSYGIVEELMKSFEIDGLVEESLRNWWNQLKSMG